MKNLKALAVGAVCGVASVLFGLGVARAECSQDDWPYQRDLAEESCDEAAQGWLEDDRLPMSSVEGMWEACMRLATPVGPVPAEQHYDTTDGAFWQVGR